MKLNVFLFTSFVCILFSSIVFAYDCDNQIGVPAVECQALVELFDQTQGENWKVKTGWKNDSDPCLWYGITCTNNSVTSLSLINNNLVGNIPNEIGNLSQLDTLRLVDNYLTGPIPTEIGNLLNLTYLNLSSCGSAKGDGIIWCINPPGKLFGNIPKELGNLTSLTYLNLAGNMLSGNIPKEIGSLTALAYLDFDSNLLCGELPNSLINLTVLSDYEQRPFATYYCGLDISDRVTTCTQQIQFCQTL
ncbi:MAG: hypothetical protein GY702_23335 [Desulfobulbaceae bacterium]|nr:hypothetical protein [Desulfobulbaceae bacterium]